MRARAIAFSSVLAVLVIYAPAARADSPAAEQFFREGRAALKREDWEKARAMFAESQRLDPTPGTLLNLAIAEDRLGKLASAWEHARTAKEGFSGADERVKIAGKLIESLHRRVPRLTLRADKPLPEGAQISVDGTALSTASLGVAIPQDPGLHVIVVRAPEHKELRADVTLAERAAEIVTIDLQRVDEPIVPVARPSSPVSPREAPPIPLRENAPPSGTIKAIGVVSIGVGAAATIAGGVLGVLALDRKDTVERLCDARGCSREGLDAADEGDLFARFSTVGFVAGAVLLASGVTLIVLAPKSPTPTRTGVSIRVSAGAALAGTF